MGLDSIKVNNNQIVTVDDKAIRNSENLIKSKGVYDIIREGKFESYDDNFSIIDALSNIGFLIDKDGIVRLKNISSSGNDFAITDEYNNIGLKLDNIGRLLVFALASNRNDLTVIDKAGNIGLQLTNDGKLKFVMSDENIENLTLNLIPKVKESIDEDKEELTLHLPDILYTVYNDCYGNGSSIKRQYALTCYIDRFLTKIQNVLFGNNSNRLSIAPDLVNGSIPNNGTQKNFFTTVNGNGYKNKDISIPIRITRSTKLINKHYRIMCLGDSLTDADYWPSYLHKLLDMDAIDYNLRTGQSANIKVNMIGIKNNTIYTDYTYRNLHVQTKNFNEGRSSWAGYTYLYHADFYTWRTVTYNGSSKSIKHCAWRILGLYEKYNQEWNGSYAQNYEMSRTCNGQYDITESCLDGWVWELYKNNAGLGSVTFDNATNVQKAQFLDYLESGILEDPINPFFDKDTVTSTKNTNFCHAFNWNKYYERYKTHDNNDQPLSQIGTKANPDTMYVSTPNYVVINLGTNDASMNNEADAEDTTYKIAQLLHQQTGATAIVFNMANPASYFPELASEQNSTQISAASISNYQARNIALKDLCGDFSQQQSSGIFFNPSYWCLRFALAESPRIVEIGTETPMGYANCVGDVHPNEVAYCDLAYEIYAQLAYLVQLGY